MVRSPQKGIQWLLLLLVLQVLLSRPSVCAADGDRSSIKMQKARMTVEGHGVFRKRLSMHWHPMMRGFADREVLVGDSVLEGAEIQMILAALEREALRHKGGEDARLLEQSFWKLLVSIRLDYSPDSALARELVRRARLHTDILQADIFLTRYSADWQPNASTAAIMGLGTLPKSADTTLLGGDAELRAELPYAVLYRSTSVSLPKAIELLHGNYGCPLSCVLDAYRLLGTQQIQEPDLTTIISTSDDRDVRIALCNLVVSTRPQGWELVLSQIKDTIPHKVINGKKVYCLSTAASWPHAGVYEAVLAAREYIGWAHRRAECRGTPGELVAFLSAPEVYSALIELKAWLIYRYHPKLFAAVLGEYLDCRKIVPESDKARYMMYLLSEVMKMHALIEVEGVDVELVWRNAYKGDDAVRTVNSLYLLESFACDADVASLLRLAREEQRISWQVQGLKYSAPLIALRAINCLSAIDSASSEKALQKIASDIRILERVRAAAAAAIE